MAWNLLINEGDVAAARLRQRLHKGYSGAPIVDRETGCVLGIATNIEKDGAEGLAISVEALNKIWSGMPPAISYFYQEKFNVITVNNKGEEINRRSHIKSGLLVKFNIVKVWRPNPYQTNNKR